MLVAARILAPVVRSSFFQGEKLMLVRVREGGGNRLSSLRIRIGRNKSKSSLILIRVCHDNDIFLYTAITVASAKSTQRKKCHFKSWEEVRDPITTPEQ